MQLYTYYRSSAAYRVRIALALKGVDHHSIPVDLLQKRDRPQWGEFAALNPAGLVPALVDDGGVVLTQSLAIMEYLDEIHPQPPFLPTGPVQRAQARALAMTVACDIHPLNNLRVLRYLKREMGVSEDLKNQWYRHWITLGLTGLERMIAGLPRDCGYVFGESPGLVECCLIPQMFNARSFAVDLSDFPTLLDIEQCCLALPAFQAAHPDAQPDKA